VTIPGTTKPEHLESNLKSIEVRLTEEDLEALASLSARVKGARYNEAGMRAVQE